MKILFMGTSEFAVPSLEKLIAEGFELVGVVTQPDRPSGRGKRLTPPPIKVIADAHNLPIYQPERVRHRDSVRALSELQPDVIVVVAFGQILPQSVLELPPYGCLNVHPSCLPKYRGAAPIQWALINGETETGVTIMLLDEGEDTGDIVLQSRLPIDILDDAATLSSRLANLAPSLLIQTLGCISDGPPPHQPQDHSQATHAPRLAKEVGQIDWNQPADQIRNLVRGVSMWPGAYTWIKSDKQIADDDIRLKITACTVVDYLGSAKLPSGTIEVTSNKELVVFTGQGSPDSVEPQNDRNELGAKHLRLDRVQPANKKEMDASAFINGYRLKTGDQLFCKETPTD
ncbi:methionyl-tRNA formyltransferase [Candidatus Poribacteria bacterium]|nr:methionyl-tRNA formyltransferase [Candidatus Poribacteria bacterium]